MSGKEHCERCRRFTHNLKRTPVAVGQHKNLCRLCRVILFDTLERHVRESDTVMKKVMAFVVDRYCRIVDNAIGDRIHGQTDTVKGVRLWRPWKGYDPTKSDDDNRGFDDEDSFQ